MTYLVEELILKPLLPDNCHTYNISDNPKNNILMSENIRQKRLMTNICIET